MEEFHPVVFPDFLKTIVSAARTKRDDARYVFMVVFHRPQVIYVGLIFP